MKLPSSFASFSFEVVFSARALPRRGFIYESRGQVKARVDGISALLEYWQGIAADLSRRAIFCKESLIRTLGGSVPQSTERRSNRDRRLGLIFEAGKALADLRCGLVKPTR